MSPNSNGRTPVPLNPGPDESRRQLAAALALAEYIVSEAPVLPASVTLHQPFGLPGEIDVDVMAATVDDVTTLQRFLGGELTVTPHADGRLFTEARGCAMGAAFRVWRLGPATPKAVAA
ncbi:hypothetical protein ACIQGZ_17545 [Streptomyces sp. NPDC092296]|uniref:hypothetical protein n=1 Tax=Streptomyces sp. NPDC092296 TaxID=3366012 RepID=UPI003805613D